MKKLLIFVCCVFVAAVVAAPASSATLRSFNVSGTWGPTAFGDTSCRSAAAFLFCATTNFQSAYNGSLSGNSRSDFVQANNCATGRVQGIGVEKFTGSIEDLGSGTLTWIIRFSATVAGDCASVTSFDGQAFIIGGTGALSRVRGTLHFTLDSYTGSLRT